MLSTLPKWAVEEDASCNESLSWGAIDAGETTATLSGAVSSGGTPESGGEGLPRTGKNEYRLKKGVRVAKAAR